MLRCFKLLLSFRLLKYLHKDGRFMLCLPLVSLKSIPSTVAGKNRDILEYNNAYNYLKGKDTSNRAKQDYYKVIKYYYSDVSDMVLNFCTFLYIRPYTFLKSATLHVKML